MSGPASAEERPAAGDAAAGTALESERWLSPGVLGVGGASLFSDASHELVTSLLPSFLTVPLHAGPAALGVIEGTSDALTGFSKLIGGPLANDPRRRGRLAAGGYLGTAVATAAIGLTTAVWQVAVLRAFAWISRGIRSPSTDMLLTSLVTKKTYGRAFGIERAGDNAGAILGPVLASPLVGLVGLRYAILLSIVPGGLAAISIILAAREARRTIGQTPVRRTLHLQLRRLRQAGLGRVLIPIACFELGNVATTLLILRATGLLTSGSRDIATATSVAILLYAAHNAMAAAASPVAGHLCDRRSPWLVFVLGAVGYAAGYAVFAAGLQGWPLLLAGFLIAGLGTGFAETAESTVVAQALPDELRGNGFGVLGLTQALGDLGSTTVVGIIWAVISPAAAFGYAAAWMGAAMISGTLLRPHRQLQETELAAAKPPNFSQKKEAGRSMTDDHPNHYVIVGVTPRQPVAVLQHAARFARHFEAVLVCANVDPGSYVVAEHSDGSIDARPIDPDLPEWTSSPFDGNLANRIQAIAQEERVQVEFRELAGEVAHALGRLGDLLHAEMIVVGSRHRGVRSTVQEFLGGSVAVHLAHRQHRPVVVIPLSPVSAEERLPWEGRKA